MVLLVGLLVQAGPQARLLGQTRLRLCPAIRWGHRLHSEVGQGCRMGFVIQGSLLLGVVVN